MNSRPWASFRRMLGGALCLGALVCISGCATLAGHWTGEALAPEMARDQFKLLRPAEQSGRLVRAELRLQDDGSYTADLNYDGRVEQSRGTWSMDSKGGYLTFVDTQGRSYGYAVRRPNDVTLEVIKGVKGTDATLTLKKQP
ncbi:MAG: hypothetical protein IPM18_13940 [Phycisphaerales bacterium]|nr:hypothetical protein [Phycisphaerales bacterium]